MIRCLSRTDLRIRLIGNCLLLQGDAAEAIDWLERGLNETPEAERRSKGQQNL